MNPLTAYGNLLRQRREQLGLTIDEAAAAVGAGEKSWRRWEAGSMPEAGFRDKIEQVFGVGLEISPRTRASREIQRIQETLDEVRAALEGTTHVGLVVESPDGDKALVCVKPLRGDEKVVIRFLDSVVREAGWKVRLTL